MNPSWSDPILTCADARALETRLFGGEEEEEWAAMQRAGKAVAEAVLRDIEEIGGFPAAGRILVLAGKGHNGGDALLAAQAILEKYPAASADVIFVFGERTLRPLAARAWRQLASGPGLPTRVQRIVLGQETHGGAESCLRPSVPYDLCLDGIFGFQFHPPVDAVAAAVLRAVNAHPAIRLRAAVDLPSGVGEPSGDTIFRADFTYATGIVKTPLLEKRNRDAVGRLRYCDLGFFALTGVGGSHAGEQPSPKIATEPAVPLPGRALPTGFVLKPSVLAPLAGWRAPRSDKRAFGHLFVIGGSRSYPGAALMCTRAALRSGVGLVTAFVPESLVPAFAACAPEAIWVGWPETPQGGLALEGLHLLRARLERATALVIGPGLGSERETHTLAEEIVKVAPVPVVLDADALQPTVLAAGAGKRIVCLPHAGEFRRLADGRISELPGGRGGMGVSPMSGPPRTTGETPVPPQAPEATGGTRPSLKATAGGPPGPRAANAAGLGSDVLRAVARETNAVIVLKGPVTRISHGDQVYHSFFGGPVLARGGSGDLLAGLVGGLLAQNGGLESYEAVPAGESGGLAVNQSSADAALLAACRGVAWHGMAADLLARNRGPVAVAVTQLLDYLPEALRESAQPDLCS